MANQHVQIDNSYLASKRQDFHQRRDRLVSRFTALAQSGSGVHLKSLYHRICLLNEMLRSLDAIAAETMAKPNPNRNHYLTSSLFLHHCFVELTKDSNENFLFVTGAEVAGRFLLEQRLSFA